eukprot:2622643-Pleurochrysis_carterae.AAC.1
MRVAMFTPAVFSLATAKVSQGQRAVLTTVIPLNLPKQGEHKATCSRRLCTVNMQESLKALTCQMRFNIAVRHRSAFLGKLAPQ